MSWQQNIRRLMGRPVGVSFGDGRGTSGILCDARDGELYVLEYLYHDQFAMKHYEYDMIRDIYPFPPCRNSPKSRPVTY